VPDYRAALTGSRRLRVGVPRAFVTEGVDVARAPAVLRRARRSATPAPRWWTSSCRTRGYAIPVYYMVCTAEASSNLARYDGVKYGYRAGGGAEMSLGTMYSTTRDGGFGAEVKRPDHALAPTC
jgi:aspartyl-tRNA(Asn)/glutamyl-tRNA(Gln) amidotransferase subunit A